MKISLESWIALAKNTIIFFIGLGPFLLLGTPILTFFGLRYDSLQSLAKFFIILYALYVFMDFLLLYLLRIFKLYTCLEFETIKQVLVFYMLLDIVLNIVSFGTAAILVPGVSCQLFTAISLYSIWAIFFKFDITVLFRKRKKVES